MTASLIGAVSLAACRTERIRRIDVGSRLPGAATAVLDSVSGRRGAHVVWVFRPEDCLSCQVATRYLRELQPVIDSLDVGLVAVNVGDMAGFVEEFLRRDRLGAVKLVQGEEALPFAMLRPTPALIIVMAGEIAEVLPVKRSRAADSLRVEEVLGHVLSRATEEKW